MEHHVDGEPDATEPLTVDDGPASPHPSETPPEASQDAVESSPEPKQSRGRPKGMTAKKPPKRPLRKKVLRGFVPADMDITRACFGDVGFLSMDSGAEHVTIWKNKSRDWLPHENPLQEVEITIKEI